MSNLDLQTERADAEKKRKEFERKEIFQNLTAYSHSLHLDPVPDPEHSADGVFSFVDEMSHTRCDGDKNKISAVNSWVILRVVISIKKTITEDTRASRRLRSLLGKGWAVKIVHQNNERELRRKFWFEITGKPNQLNIKL